MAYLLLALAQIVGLILIPFGLPGLWLQVGALVAFGWATDFATVSTFALGIVFFLAVAAEIAEFVLASRYAQKYGGGRRASVGALVGGVAGALLGLPIPLLGSVFGALLGAFAGALALELTTGRGAAPAVRAGWGALIGRLVASALKGGVGVVIAVFALLTTFR